TINTEYFDNIIAQIDNISNCTALEEAKDQLEAEGQKILDGIIDQLALLLPLISIPDPNFGAIIDYITALVAIYTKPYNDLISLQAQYTAKFLEIADKISEKSDTLNCNL
ncbi:unnamed protein product, partial [marine sediment metagenome]